MSRPTRKERERERVRREILEAAEKVFSLHGFHNTTIGMIAAAAELSVGSIYNFYPGKEALFYSIIEKNATEGLGQLREAVDALDCPVEKLRTVIRRKVGYFVEHYGFFRIFIGMASASYRPHIEKDQPIVLVYHGYMEWLESVCRTAIEQGKIKTLSPQVLAVSLEGLTFGIIEHWDRLEEMKDIQMITDMIEEVFFRGILVEP